MPFDPNKLESSQAYSTNNNEYPDYNYKETEETESQKETDEVLCEFDYYLERNIQDYTLKSDLFNLFKKRVEGMRQEDFEAQYNKMFY